jgi:hypothetical protein
MPSNCMQDGRIKTWKIPSTSAGILAAPAWRPTGQAGSERRRWIAHVGPRRRAVARLTTTTTNDKRPRRGASWANGWPDSYDALPRPNLPRSIFLNRASFPLFWISRRIAEYTPMSYQVKPRAHGFFPPPRSSFTCQDQNRRLKCIFGIVPVMQHTLTAVQNHGAMTAHQGAKRLFIALLGKTPQQLPV